MKYNKFLSFFAVISFLTLSIFSFNIAAQSFEVKSSEFPDQLTSDSLEGVWGLNIAESDDPMQKVRTLIQKSFTNSDKTESAGQAEKPGISISMFPPEKLVLAGSENEMTINEFYPDYISTRTYINDGLPHFYQANSDTEIAVSARQEKNKLLIETVSPRNNLMEETFELFANGNKLKVTVRISDANFQELLTLHRIYDRAILDDLSEYN